ncbi:hypothetical protein ACFWNR_06150 [Streptomyces virginiae]|uniref:hypothetical protein n=1 Tax=Streptomyces virginiae TaxID=1961 RepID=UPI003668F605
MSASTEAVALLSESPVLVAPALLQALDLSPHPVPAWITDEAVRDSIRDGLIDIPDDLLRGPS